MVSPLPTAPRFAPVIVIGAGPGGLTTAYTLAKGGIRALVLEADPVNVGGISRTEWRGEFGFDIGGHRFFSKSTEVNELWNELLAHEMLTRPRASRIYYRGRLFAYPIRPVDALIKLGPLEAVRCVISYAWARLRPIRPVRSFEDWTVNAFGRRLFSIFFKTYTEKVWGMSTADISADWAAQRISGLSLIRALTDPLMSAFRRGADGPKSLITSFRYPRLGPGMMWEEARRRIESLGGEVRMGERVIGLQRLDAGDARWLVRTREHDGTLAEYAARDVVSTAPLGELWPTVIPEPTSIGAARDLRYRDFLTVALVLRDHDAFPDNWIYIHEPGVRVGRIQNFRSWSPDLVGVPGVVCYGMEYFCFEGDGLWTMTDVALVELAVRELEQLQLGHGSHLVDGFVVRQPKAYPVYDDEYADRVARIREEIDASYPGLHLVGRNGMHRYNNQDHAMMTGLIVARNIAAGTTLQDPWLVNVDAEYHEEARGESGLRHVPTRV